MTEWRFFGQYLASQISVQWWANSIFFLYSDHDQTPVHSETRKKSSHQQDDHEYQVLHDFATKEFVLFCDEDRSSKAYVKYEVVSNQSIHFLTTQVPISQKGKGIGKILVKEVLEFCVENQMRFSSSCWYIDDYITKYPSKKYRKLFQKWNWSVNVQNY